MFRLHPLHVPRDGMRSHRSALPFVARLGNLFTVENLRKPRLANERKPCAAAKSLVEQSLSLLTRSRPPTPVKVNCCISLSKHRPPRCARPAVLATWPLTAPLWAPTLMSAATATVRVQFTPWRASCTTRTLISPLSCATMAVRIEISGTLLSQGDNFFVKTKLQRKMTKALNLQGLQTLLEVAGLRQVP